MHETVEFSSSGVRGCHASHGTGSGGGRRFESGNGGAGTERLHVCEEGAGRWRQRGGARIDHFEGKLRTHPEMRRGGKRTNWGGGEGTERGKEEEGEKEETRKRGRVDGGTKEGRGREDVERIVNFPMFSILKMI